MKTLPIRLPVLLFSSALAALAQPFTLAVPIRALAQDAGKPVPIAWVATEGGIFKSSETTLDWRNVYVRPAGEVQPAVRSIHIDPSNTQIVYLISDIEEGGIWKSVNGGVTWTQANTGLPRTGALDAFIALPGAALTFYLKAGNQIYKTTDGAATWILRGFLPPGANVFEVNRATPAQMFAAVRNAVYRSRDEGINWTLAETLSVSRISSILVDPSNPLTIHLIVPGPKGTRAGFYRSTDGGERFGTVTAVELDRFEPRQMVSDPAGRVIYAGADEDGVIFRTDDKGANWFRIDGLRGAGYTILAIDPADPRVVLAGTGRGLFGSNNSGGNWFGRAGPARPTLGVPSVPLDFTLAAGSQGRLRVPLQVVETNLWTLPVSASTEGASWLSLTGTAINTPATPSLIVNAGDLETGDYTGTLRVDAPLAGNSLLRAPVKLTVVLPRPVSEAYRITTAAGNGQRGNFGDGQPATRAFFGDLDSIALDRDGNIFLSDPASNVVRRIGQDGVIARYAGTAQRGSGGDGGSALLAQLSSPSGLAVDAAGNLFIADTGNGKIRRVTPDGVISTFASGVGPARGIAVDSGGNVYLTVAPMHAILRVTRAGQISLYAGEPGVAGFRGDGGVPGAARLSGPLDIFVDAKDQVFIADSGNNRIRRVSAGIITTVAGSGAYGFQGDGPDATKVAFANPGAVAADGAGNIYVADTENHRVRIVRPSGLVRTISGTGSSGFGGDNGPATRALITGPQDVLVEAGGSVLSVESVNLRIRRLTPPPAPVLPVITEGPVNWADDSPRLAPGTIFRLKGSDLAVETLSRPNAPWPVDLGGARVTLNGAPLPLSRVSPGEIVGLIPYGAPLGAGSLVVSRDDVPSAEVIVTLEPTAPAIVLREPGRALAANENGSANSGSDPAAPDSVLTVFFTGAGLTENPPLGGTGAGEESKPLLPVLVQFGDLTLEPLLTRLSPGRVGIAETQFRVPVNEAGDYPVMVRVGDGASASALVSVKAN